MIEAKSGKIDTNYFKNIIQEEVVGDICVSFTYISDGYWIFLHILIIKIKMDKQK